MTHAPGRAAAASTLNASVARGVDLGRAALRGVLLLVNAAAIATLLAFFATETIDDDLEFSPSEPTEGGLASVDMAAALIEREVSDNPWVPNEPSFMPGYWLGNMASYQKGMMYGLSRFAFELADSIGRRRGATAVDPDLDSAAGLLRFPADVWIFDFGKTWTPQTTSEDHYLAAAAALRNYNSRIASGDAVFDPRADNLFSALERMEADVSSAANILVNHIERVAAGQEPLETANDVFFTTKGRMYAYALILRELGRDFTPVLEREGLDVVWPGLITSLNNAAIMNPVFILDGTPGSMLVPSHVAELGFFVLRVKTQLRDVMGVLRES